MSKESSPWESLSAVKSYGRYISVLTHIAEGDIDKTVGDSARMEGELRDMRKELTECKAERDQLQKEKKDYLAEKTRLDEEVKRLTQEEERLTTELEQVKKDWENAQAELGSCNEALGGVAAHFPKLAEGTSLADAVSELKESVIASFEDNFNLALAQMRVLHPEDDDSKFDTYKVVRDGRIVDEEEEAPAAVENVPAKAGPAR